MKRAYKLQEFVAHTSHVNCLKIGRKSAGVLVTGGEDKKVNVWTIGKPTPVLSLSGHQSAVECVSFDSAEEVVVAGATGGTVKLWDLEQAKVTRTMTGHRSSCLSVDFHPFGDYFASGSLDTSVKVWDVRRKACISTYKGHSRGATHVQFSPDGRLLTSGGQDGDLKVWELTAGKLLHEFKHDDAITAIEYHPSEFILATSSADRTVKWWDLESSELIDTGPDMTGVRSILFPGGGDCLLAAVQDGLKVWAWEPVRRLDTLDIPWAKVQDMSLNEQDGKLVACSCNNSFVGVWVVELNKIKPFSGPAVRPTPSQPVCTTLSRLVSHAGSSPSDVNRRQSSSMFASPQLPTLPGPPAAPSNSAGQSPLLQQQQQQHLPSPLMGLIPGPISHAQDQGPSALSPALIRATKAPQAFRRSPLSYSTDTATLPWNARRAPPAAGDGLVSQRQSHSVVGTKAQTDEGGMGCWPAQGIAFSSQPALNLSPNANSPIHSRTTPTHSLATTPTPTTNPHPAIPPQQLFSASDTHPPPPQGAPGGVQGGPHSQGPSTPPHPVAMLAQEALQGNRKTPFRQHEEATAQETEGIIPKGGAGSADPLGGMGAKEGCSWKDREAPASNEFAESSGLDIDAFLPPSLSPRQGHTMLGGSDTELMTQLLAKHQTVMSILSSRQASLKIVRGFWAQGDVRGALAAMLQSADASVAMDVLSVIKDSPHLLKLDNCSYIASCLPLLLVAAHKTYIQTALETALVLLSTFGDVIQQTCRQDVNSVGVDLSFDERKTKCQNARASLKQLCHALHGLPNTSDQSQLMKNRLLNLLTTL